MAWCTKIPNSRINLNIKFQVSFKKAIKPIITVTDNTIVNLKNKNSVVNYFQHINLNQLQYTLQHNN